MLAKRPAQNNQVGGPGQTRSTLWTTFLQSRKSTHHSHTIKVFSVQTVARNRIRNSIRVLALYQCNYCFNWYSIFFFLYRTIQVRSINWGASSKRRLECTKGIVENQVQNVFRAAMAMAGVFTIPRCPSYNISLRKEKRQRTNSRRKQQRPMR